jgi:O-antigen/teichoic acid export membrane protein
MSNLRTQTLWSMVPILVTSIISIISVPIYFRVLGDEMYAMWFYVGTLTGAFGFMDLGLGVAVGRFVGVALGKGDKEAVREYWATGHAIVLPFVLFFAALFVVLGTVWGPVWFKVPEADTSTLRWAMVWGGVGLFFAYYGQMWNVLAQSFLDFRYLSILRTWTSLLATLGSLAVAVTTRDVAAIVFFNTALGLVAFFILFRRATKSYHLPVQFHHYRLARLKEMLPYTLKTFGQLVSGSVLGSLDRIFLGRVAPAADFAAFNVSMNIGLRLSGLSVAIMGPIFHNTTRGVGGDASRNPAAVYRESFNFMFPWYSLAIICTFFWSGPVTGVWLGPTYGAAVGETFPWVVSALCINAIANISGAQLGGLDRVGTGVVIQTISSVLSAALTLAGWNVHGLQGAAIGYFLARLIWWIQDALVRQWVGLGLREYSTVLPVVVRQAAIVCCVWLLFRTLPEDPVTQSLGAVLSALLAAGLELAIELRRRPT